MRLLVLLFIVSVTGCSAPPKPSTAARQEAALEANRKGEAYVRHGELENAARSYREALRFSQALEDADGIAANAINLSIVRQRQGRFADARASLAAVLEQRDLKFSNARLAEVSLRQSLLDLDEKNLAGADDWMAKAAGHCAERCPAGAAIQNVRAQLALQAGRTDAALLAARSAHEASRASGDQAEQANALRLLGIVGLKNGDAASARQHLEQALAIDRELGAPRKIALDLLALGQAAALSGDRESARAYYARALAVGEADRDVAVAAEARALLAQ
ncbi:MAG TPA: tetratricopeptide repeat protein [Burkholderiales bacterium]|nr:tetratricopeptide repeat protein [Burkholderiales bacterium]